MALVLADRVKETTTTTGTGTITLAGASTGYQSFSAVGNSNTTYYSIVGQGNSEWEVGIGTYTSSGTTLSRDTVLSSSAGGTTKTNFSAGTKDVFVTYPSSKSAYFDETSLVFKDNTSQPTAATGFGFKNRIINGAMGISQRGTSFSISTSVYTYALDRWSGASTGAAATVAQVAGIGGFQNALQITGAASNTQTYISQRIESNNIADLASTTVTLSAVMQASSNQTVLWQAYLPTARDNYTSTTLISSGTFSVTTSATTVSTQIALPANAVNGLWIVIFPNNAGAFTSGTLTITGVQLEKGSTATSFDYRPYGTELALCMRYAYQYVSPSAKGVGDGTSMTRAGFNHPVPMRAAPTATLIGTVPTYDGSTVRNISSILNSYMTSTVFEVDFATGGSVAGRAMTIYQGTGSILVSAEL